MNDPVRQKRGVALVVFATLALLPVVRGEESERPRPDHEASTVVDESGKRRAAHEVTALVKQAFPYAPVVVQKKEETKEPDAQVVTMERFTVVESRRSRELEQKIESDNEKMRGEKFTILKGGTIWKKGRVELGAWSAQGGINFFKLSW